MSGLAIECARRPTALRVAATVLLAVVGTATEIAIWFWLRGRWAHGVPVEPKPSGRLTWKERLELAMVVLLYLGAVAFKMSGLDGTGMDKVIAFSFIVALIVTALVIDAVQRRRR